MNIQLLWHGPFSIVDGTGLPNLLTTDFEPATHPGVYLWTIERNGEEWIHYVGKAERGLRARAKEEFRERPAKYSYIPDPEKLKNGIREVAVYSPLDSKGTPDEELWQQNPEYFTKCSKEYGRMLRIYIAPMQDSLEHIRQTEAALIHAVWDYEEANWPSDIQEYYFLRAFGNNEIMIPETSYISRSS